MALINISTTRSTVVCSVFVSLVVLATICSTLPSCHALTESNKPVHVVCKTPDPCFDDNGCKAMCERNGMHFYLNTCRRASLPECCCYEI
uniref:Predicted protein n=1 Tax=Hordeum vulgare subsp. vulgare TaxID=112509 RepID=F2EI73_HORVV|nr:predicted protein [Hordeum vulgare subsp. vulgare]